MRHARRKTGSRTWLGVVLGFRLGLGLEQEHGQPHLVRGRVRVKVRVGVGAGRWAAAPL